MLHDPKKEWPYPAVTTFMKGNHSIRYKNWRYIRYNDGTEELYDLHADPNEWINLAGKEEHNVLKHDLLKWIPAHNADHIPDWEKPAKQ